MESKKFNNWSEFLDALLDKYRLTGYSLSRKSDIDESTISRIRNKKSIPSPKFVSDLENALNLKIYDDEKEGIWWEELPGGRNVVKEPAGKYFAEIEHLKKIIEAKENEITLLVNDLNKHKDESIKNALQAEAYKEARDKEAELNKTLNKIIEGLQNTQGILQRQIERLESENIKRKDQLNKK